MSTMTKDDLINLLDRMAAETKDQRVNLRLNGAEKQALGKLAQVYKRPMSEVITDLIRQGIIDYVTEGECFALSKY